MRKDTVGWRRGKQGRIQWDGEGANEEGYNEMEKGQMRKDTEGQRRDTQGRIQWDGFT